MEKNRSNAGLLKAVLAVVFSVSCVVAVAPQALSAPEIFGNLSYEDGVKQAKKSGKLLVVDFMAEWCGPCKQMDKLVWPADGVFSFLKKNTICVQIDVDKRKDIAQKYGVTGMPTIIMFRAPSYDKPFDRVIGFLTPPEMLAWLKAANQGKKHADVLRESAKATIGSGGAPEVKARFQLAQQAFADKNYDSTADELAWIWKNIPKEAPQLMAVRGTAIAQQMQSLVALNPASKAKFKPLRDAIEPDAMKGKSAAMMDDWMTLNDVLGEKDRTLKWFDKVKTDKASQGILAKGGFRLVDVLISSNRWKDVIYVYPDPKATLKRSVQLRKELPAHEAEFGQKIFRVESAVCYASLLANKRDKEASDFALLVLKEDQSTALRAAMVRMALSAGEARGEQLDWLKDLPQIAKAVNAKLKK